MCLHNIINICLLLQVQCRLPSNSSFDLADPKFSYTTGTVVTLRCAKGYQLVGSDTVKCKEIGTSFPHLSNCEPMGVRSDPPEQGNTSLLPDTGPGNRLQGKCYSGCVGVICL